MQRRSSARAKHVEVIRGIRISHPDRPIYPDLGITKLDLARYYDAIGGWMLPHVRGRPLTLLHCPDGLRGPCHFLRHSKVWGPDALRRIRIREKTKVGEYLVADSIAAIIALAQMGVVEIHTWNSCADHIEQPDRIIWDLDPGPEVAWTQTATAARLLRSVLELLGLESWIKTTGGRGLHIVVPLEPVREWPECLSFARAVAQSIERTDPRMFTTAFGKQGRERKILIDYLRNNRTNTSIAAFSTRARQGAPVSIPIAWRELGRTPPRFDMRTVTARFTRRRADPWRDYWRTRQRVTDRALRAIRDL
ncbi:MAG TPA: non-homologous end-joining DNA ligase [Vicinamibacterales bacterium]